MDLLKILKCLVFIFSFVMFCYQLHTATVNLMDPPTVLSQHERHINDDDLPLITVCPTNQINITRLKKLGYKLHHGYDDMLLGKAKCNETTWCTSWGGHQNLTFEELAVQVFDLDKVNRNVRMIKVEQFKDITKFIPAYGLCREISFLNYSQEIQLGHWNKDEARMFITDRNYRSYIMPSVASHVGSKLFMKPYTYYFINVQIKERANCKRDEKPMSEEDYKKCVDENIQNEFKKNDIICVPPWLSNNNQCNKTYPTFRKFFGKFEKDMVNYVDMLGILRNIRLEKECRQSCKETTYVVDEGSKVGKALSLASITFNEKVIVTEKVPNYDLFKYIIDVGSSLGLWLGLSVLGLHDLVVLTVQFVNNSFIIKKIRSAVTK